MEVYDKSAALYNGHEEQIEREKMRCEASIGFMREDHRRVHSFVVRQLPGPRKPLSPDVIANNTGLGRIHVISIPDDLEKHMTFLFRNKQGNVTWACPVTVERTPHHLTFSSGEQVYAA